jgi:hypothetical protein
MEEDKIKLAFPQLGTDNRFKITSDDDPDYNCIAWALVYDNQYIWPNNLALDGIYWPNHLPRNETIETFIELFRFHGHEICDSAEVERGFRKIALYVDADMNCKHAARQKQNGLWYSKLGKENDIVHSTPESLEGQIYGRVHCIMKKSTV